MKSEHEKAIFADVVKGAMERGIDGPKIIADLLKKHAQAPAAALVERAKPTRRWRCPDCGIPNLWDALECVRCRLISPPDKERWEFQPFVRSDRERLTDSTAVAVQAQAPSPAGVERPALLTHECPRHGWVVDEHRCEAFTNGAALVERAKPEPKESEYESPNQNRTGHDGVVPCDVSDQRVGDPAVPSAIPVAVAPSPAGVERATLDRDPIAEHMDMLFKHYGSAEAVIQAVMAAQPSEAARREEKANRER